MGNSKQENDRRRQEQALQRQNQQNQYLSQPGQEIIQTPYQANLQMADDTWERVLCALERLEYLTEEVRLQRSATRLDRHRDRDHIQVSVVHAQEEVNLQVSAFYRVLSPVRSDECERLLKDFLCWFGGRERMGLQFNITDEYAIPVINCITGVPYKSLNLPEPDDRQQSEPILQNNQGNLEMMSAIEQLGAGLHETDRIIDDFAQNPQKQATQHSHERGTLNEGMKRLQDFADACKQTQWFNRFGQEYWKRLQKL